MPFTRDLKKNQRFAVLAAALLLLGACTQKMDMRETAPNAGSPTQASSPAAVEKLQSGQAAERAYDSLAAPSAPAGSVATESQRLARESASFGSGALSRYPHPSPPYFPHPPVIPRGVDRFPDKEPTSVLSAAEHPVSTFSVDVDRRRTHSFAAVSLAGACRRAKPFVSKKWSTISPMLIPLLPIARRRFV